MKRFRPEHYMLLGIIIIAFPILAILESPKPEKRDQAPAAVVEDEPDIQVLTSKQEQYCYRINKHLPEPRLTEEIELCKVRTAEWTLEQFEAEMHQ